MTLLHMGLLNFHSTLKILFSIHLKQSSLWSSAVVKPMSNDLEYAMHGILVKTGLNSVYRDIFGAL